MQANLVGTSGTGGGPTHALANDLDGVRIANAPDNLIGGTTAGTGNVVSANLGNGIQIIGAGARATSWPAISSALTPREPSGWATS